MMMMSRARPVSHRSFSPSCSSSSSSSSSESESVPAITLAGLADTKKLKGLARRWMETSADSLSARLQRDVDPSVKDEKEQRAVDASNELAAHCLADGDVECWETIKSTSQTQMDGYVVGCAILARDVQRGKPVDAWSSFWFAMLLMNTIPFTPIFIQLLDKVPNLPQEKYIPRQLTPSDERLARVVRARGRKTSP